MEPYPGLPDKWYPMLPMDAYWNLDAEDNIHICKRKLTNKSTKKQPKINQNSTKNLPKIDQKSTKNLSKLDSWGVLAPRAKKPFNSHFADLPGPPSWGPKSIKIRPKIDPKSDQFFDCFFD